MLCSAKSSLDLFNDSTGSSSQGCRNKFFMRGHPLWMCLFFILAGCQSDITLSDSRETMVIVDSFIQPDPVDQLDVLISLDTSCSMGDNYGDVSSGVELLRLDIEDLTLDYQIGYITMDPTRLSYAGPYDASSSAIDIMLAPSLLPGTQWEEGFAATYMFLNSDEGEEFRREDSDFLLFLISDEDEQSEISADMFHMWLLDEFQDVRHDVVTVVQIEDSWCGSSFDVGYKYAELALFYHKDPIDICEDNWSVWLSQSSYLTQTRDSIVLSDNSPIVSTLVVYVDQVIISDWVYVEEENKVQLGFIPDYGSLVEVGYEVYVN